MRKFVILIILGLFVSTSFAQNKLSKLHSKQDLDCTMCHRCETPTKLNPCLTLCPRENIKAITYRINDSPAVIEINNIQGEKDIYGPSMFSHKEHAEMSEMSGGCTICHHYNPPGEIVKCGFCHEVDRDKSNINMPDLKSAYHRQCMDCHSEWEKKSDCEDCHTLNDKFRSVIPSSQITKMYEPVTRPKVLVYQTAEHKEGILATFHHDDHVDLFGTECSDCHQDESCQSCHNQKANFQKIIDATEHSRCESCHNTEDKNQCVKCHSNEERKPFNHFVSTGFGLAQYHSKTSCNSCHTKAGEFSGLQTQCQSCHDWDIDNFNHSIVGLQLDDDHYDLECSDCHEDEEGNLSYKKANCISCHEEDEGYLFPNKLPGKIVK